MTNETVNLIAVILAIGAALSPFLLGYLVMQLTKWFTPKSEFSLLKEQLSREHAENTSAISELRADVKLLLQK